MSVIPRDTIKDIIAPGFTQWSAVIILVGIVIMFDMTIFAMPSTTSSTTVATTSRSMRARSVVNDFCRFD